MILQMPSVLAITFVLVAILSSADAVKWFGQHQKNLLSKKYVVKGSLVEFDCRRLDNSLATVFLSRLAKGKESDLTVDGSKVVQIGQIFTVYNFQQKDDGAYSCQSPKPDGLRSHLLLGKHQAINPAGNLSPPTTNVSSIKQEALEGSTAILTCRATKNGKSTIKSVKWYKNLLPMSQRLQYSSQNGRVHTTRLKLTDLDIDESGSYECRSCLFHSIPSIRACWTAKTELIVEEFKFLTKGRSFIVEDAGTSTSIDCETNDSNSTLVLMRKDGNGAFTKVTPDGSKIVKKGGKFVINNINMKDEGKYMCKASSVTGRNISKPVETLVVLQGGHRNPKAYMTPSAKTLFVGDSFNFSCHAFGDDISITWLKNNRSVPSGMVSSLPSRRHQGYTEFMSVLTIKKAQASNAGTYVCRISSGRQPGYRYNATAIVKILECRKPNGQFADPNDRSAYFVCKNNIAKKRKCPSPSYWDDQQKKCEVPPTTPTPAFLKWLTGPLRWVPVPLFASYKFDCRLSIPTANVTLMKKGSIVPIDGRKFTQSGQTFTVNNAMESDSGYYSCRTDGLADLKFDIYVDRYTTLKLTITMIPRSDEVLVLETTYNYTITCKSRYLGKPSWHKVDPVTNALTLIKKHTSREDYAAVGGKETIWSLSLLNVTPKDSGIYMCRKWHRISGNVSRSIQVDVRAPVKPDIVTNSTVEVTQSKSLTLTMNVTGSPAPDVTMTTERGVTQITCHGGQKMMCTSSNNRRYSGTWSGKIGYRTLTITISKVSFVSENGIMSLLARNFKGKMEKKVNVVVNVVPVLVKAEELQFAYDNTVRNLTCKVKEAVPSARLKWTYQPWRCDRIDHKDCNPLKKEWKPVDPGIVTWSKDSQESILTVPGNKELAFYRCTASNKVGKAKLVYRLLRTEKRNNDLKIVQGNSLVATKGDMVTISCKAKLHFIGPPYWIDDNGKQVTNSSRIRVTKTLGRKANIVTITISNAFLNDSGIYTCMASKKNNMPTSVFVRLSVLEITPPAITFESQTVNESTHVTLTCTVSGYPLPTVQWYKNGQLISTHHSLQSVNDCAIRKRNRYYYLENFSPVEPGKARTRTVVICEAKHTDSGLYMCLATNIGGDANKTAYLDVLAKPKIHFTSIKQSLIEGDDVIVNCNATGNPVPEVRWLKESEDGTFSPYKDSSWSKNNTYLTIQDLKKDDFAAYKCEARNKMGEAEKAISITQTPIFSKYTSKNKELLSNTAKIIIGVVGSFSFVVVLVVIAVLYRRKKLYGGFYILTLPPMPDYLKKLDPQRPIQEQTHKLPLCADWEFPRNRLTLGKVIGSGAFGQVFKADAVGIVAFDPRSSIKGKGRRRSRFGSTRSHYYSNRQVTVVACKGLKEDASESEYKDLISELKILMHIGEHKNIVNLLGACTKGRECEVLVIIEFCPHGNLLEFLRNRRDIFQATWAPATEKPDESFSTTDLVITAFQVARAMEFLATRRCVHRDLAARNVLVGENYVMKVADFGLARDICNEDHYVKRTSGLLPVKWMAIEALVERIYTHQSDVWSFGVLLWEIFTLGGSPYPGLPANEVYQYLMEGQRMHQPEDSPEQMYHLMQTCWRHDPNERPVFSSIVQTIDKLLEGTATQTGEEYLELENEIDPRENQPYYLQPEEIQSFQRPPESPSSPFDNLHSPLPPLPQDEMELQQLIKRSDSDDHNSNTRDFVLKDVPKGKKKNHFEYDHELDQQKKSDSSGIVSDEEDCQSEDEHLMKDYVFDPPSPYVNSKPYNYSNEVHLPKKGKDGRKESARYV